MNRRRDDLDETREAEGALITVLATICAVAFLVITGVFLLL